MASPSPPEMAATMATMDDHICELFYRVLKNHLTDGFSQTDVRAIKKTLPEIRKKPVKGRKVKEDTVRGLPTTVVISHAPASSVLRNAYTYECSLCLSSAIAEELRDLRRNNVDFFRRKEGRRSVNVCCLAGSLGAKAVAAVEVLNRSIFGHHEVANDRRFTNYRITVVNNDREWEGVHEAVMEELKNHVLRKFGAKVTSEFLVAYDYPGSLNQAALQAFQKADVVLASKLSQEWCKIGDRDFRRLLMEAVRNMKPDSLLFFADFGTSDFLHSLGSDVNESGSSIKIVYKRTNQLHSLCMQTIAQHFENYGEYFGKDLGSSYCVLSVTAWLKCDRRHEGKTRPQPKCAMKADIAKGVRKELDEFAKNVERAQKNPPSLAVAKSSSEQSEAITGVSFEDHCKTEDSHALNKAPSASKEAGREPPAYHGELDISKSDAKVDHWKVTKGKRVKKPAEISRTLQKPGTVPPSYDTSHDTSHWHKGLRWNGPRFAPVPVHTSGSPDRRIPLSEFLDHALAMEGSSKKSKAKAQNLQRQQTTSDPCEAIVVETKLSKDESAARPRNVSAQGADLKNLVSGGKFDNAIRDFENGNTVAGNSGPEGSGRIGTLSHKLRKELLKIFEETNARATAAKKLDDDKGKPRNRQEFAGWTVPASAPHKGTISNGKANEALKGSALELHQKCKTKGLSPATHDSELPSGGLEGEVGDPTILQTALTGPRFDGQSSKSVGDGRREVESRENSVGNEMKVSRKKKRKPKKKRKSKKKGKSKCKRCR